MSDNDPWPEYEAVSANAAHEYARMPAFAVHWSKTGQVLVGGGGGKAGTGIRSGILVNDITPSGILKPTGLLDTGDGIVLAIAGHPSENVVACAINKYVYVIQWDTSTSSLKPVHRVKMSFADPHSCLCAITFDQSGGVILAGAEDGAGHTLTYPQLSILKEFKFHKDAVSAVTINRTGQLVAIAAKEAQCSVWHADLSSMWTLSYRSMQFRGCAFSVHDDNVLFAWLNGRSRSYLSMWDAFEGVCLRSVSVDDNVATKGIVSDDGSLVAVATMKNNSTAYSFDTRTMSLVGRNRLPHELPQTDMDFSPIGDRIVSVSADMSHDIVRSRTRTGRLCNNLSLFLVVVACLTVLLSYSWQPLGLPTSFDNLFWEEDLPSYLDDAILDADYAADFEYPDSREPGEPFEYSDIVEGTELASPAPAGSEPSLYNGEGDVDDSTEEATVPGSPTELPDGPETSSPLGGPGVNLRAGNPSVASSRDKQHPAFEAPMSENPSRDTSVPASQDGPAVDECAFDECNEGSSPPAPPLNHITGEPDKDVHEDDPTASGSAFAGDVSGASQQNEASYAEVVQSAPEPGHVAHASKHREVLTGDRIDSRSQTRHASESSAKGGRRSEDAQPKPATGHVQAESDSEASASTRATGAQTDRGLHPERNKQVHTGGDASADRDASSPQDRRQHTAPESSSSVPPAGGDEVQPEADFHNAGTSTDGRPRVSEHVSAGYRPATEADERAHAPLPDETMESSRLPGDSTTAGAADSPDDNQPAGSDHPAGQSDPDLQPPDMQPIEDTTHGGTRPDDASRAQNGQDIKDLPDQVASDVPGSHGGAAEQPAASSSTAPDRSDASGDEQRKDQDSGIAAGIRERVLGSPARHQPDSPLRRKRGKHH
ncbi:Anaphase-promoting complex subunit 4 WD40 domain-containing protein [Plasmodiophora brassicae]